jgi:hypothetical protein
MWVFLILMICCGASCAGIERAGNYWSSDCPGTDGDGEGGNTGVLGRDELKKWWKYMARFISQQYHNMLQKYK